MEAPEDNKTKNDPNFGRSRHTNYGQNEILAMKNGLVTKDGEIKKLNAKDREARGRP